MTTDQCITLRQIGKTCTNLTIKTLNVVKSITGVLGKGNHCLYYQLCIDS